MSKALKLLMVIYVFSCAAFAAISEEAKGKPSMEMLLEQLANDDLEVVQRAQKELDDRFDEALKLIDTVFDNAITKDEMFGVKINLLNVLKRGLKVEANVEGANAALKKIIAHDNKFSPLADDIIHDYSEILRRLKSLKFYKNRETKNYNYFNKWEIDHLKELTELNLSYYKLEQDDLACICRLEKLTSLRLYRSNAVDADIEIIKMLPALTNLELGCTAVTDSGVALLKEIKTLTTLNLHDTAITEGALETLKTALPNCSIEIVLKASAQTTKEEVK